MPDVTLTVDGLRHEGWKKVSVALSMESISGSFDLSVSERWPESKERRPISPGARCTVAIHGETVITGHVDDVAPSFDARNHAVAINGRDLAADLVDCAALHEPGEWQGQTLDKLAAIIAEPFGIPVRVETDIGKPFVKFTLQPGETAFEAIERGARMRGVLALSDGAGRLILTRAGTVDSNATLNRENILAARGTYSMRDRYGRYIVKGQEAGLGGWGDAEPSGEALDATVGRYRPLVVIAEEPADGLSLDDRAKWEASMRAGRARRIGVTVAGWMHGGALWRPNQLVGISDDWLGVDRKMLIAGVTFSRDMERGTVTELSLSRPEAFDILPVPDTEDVGW